MTSTALLLAWRALRCNTCAPAAAARRHRPVSQERPAACTGLPRAVARRASPCTLESTWHCGDGLTAPIHCLSVRTGMSVASHTATSIATARMAATESGRNGGHASREYHWHIAINHLSRCQCGQCGLS